MLTLGEQLRKNIAEEKLREEKALSQRLKRYTDDISKWIQEGKTLSVIKYKAEPKLFEKEPLLFLEKWADENDMIIILNNKGYTLEHSFYFQPKEL